MENVEGIMRCGALTSLVDSALEQKLVKAAREKFPKDRIIITQRQTFSQEGNLDSAEYSLIAVKADEYFCSGHSWEEVLDRLLVF